MLCVSVTGVQKVDKATGMAFTHIDMNLFSLNKW